MTRTFRYRLCPTRIQEDVLTLTLETCREVYNMALEQRHYQRIGRFAQGRELSQLRRLFPEYQAVNAHVLDDTLKRLDRAYQAFFRRLKNGERPGFPRFKGRDRFDSFTFRGDAFSFDGSRVRLSKVGEVKFRNSRPFPQSAIPKECVIYRRLGKWYCCVSLAYQSEPLPASAERTGVDVGISSFAALSTGELIANPRTYETSQRELRTASRRLARAKRGSMRRKATKLLLAKVHERIANRRSDFLHKESRKLVNKYGLIAVEKLNVAGLARMNLSKQVHDASWGMFFRYLSYKAAEAGREFVEVDPKGTSQTCPACGNVKSKSLREREHICGCGYRANRDIAAARVILARALPSNANVRSFQSYA